MNEGTPLSGSVANGDDDLLSAYTAGQLLGRYPRWVERHFEPDEFMRLEGGARRPLYRASKIEAQVR